MAVFLYSGKNRSGKTYLMCWHVFLEWIQGRNVYSTVKLFYKLESCGLLEIWWRKIRGWTGVGEIHYFQSLYEILHVKNACIMFDEGQNLFYARYFDKLPIEFVYKITQQAKQGLDLYCTAPDAMMIDVQYIRLIHAWYHCETSFAFPRSGKKWIQLSHVYVKDTAFAERGKDVRLVPNLATERLWIGKLTGKPTLYDTHFVINFQRFKSIFVNNLCQKNEKIVSQQKAYILPKEMSISEALKSLRSYEFTSSRNKSANSRTD